MINPAQENLAEPSEQQTTDPFQQQETDPKHQNITRCKTGGQNDLTQTLIDDQICEPPVVKRKGSINNEQRSTKEIVAQSLFPLFKRDSGQGLRPDQIKPKRRTFVECLKYCCCCVCFKAKPKSALEFMFKPVEESISLSQILESLYGKYDSQMVKLIWSKPLHNFADKDSHIRDDIEYFLMQLMNYWLSYLPKQEKELQNLFMSSSQGDMFFSHQLVGFLLAFYFPENSNNYVHNIKIEELISKIVEYSKERFTIEHFIKGAHIIRIPDLRDKVLSEFKVYKPVAKHNFDPKSGMSGLYDSELYFLMDLVAITGLFRQSDHIDKRKQKIKEKLGQINKSLPSFVYLPSRLSKLKGHMIMRIQASETKVFPTKTKTNFMVCFELVKAEEFIMRTTYPYKDNREKIIKSKIIKIQEQDLRQSMSAKRLYRNQMKIIGEAEQFKKMSMSSYQALDVNQTPTAKSRVHNNEFPDSKAKDKKDSNGTSIKNKSQKQTKSAVDRQELQKMYEQQQEEDEIYNPMKDYKIFKRPQELMDDDQNYQNELQEVKTRFPGNDNPAGLNYCKNLVKPLKRRKSCEASLYSTDPYITSQNSKQIGFIDNDPLNQMITEKRNTRAIGETGHISNLMDQHPLDDSKTFVKAPQQSINSGSNTSSILQKMRAKRPQIKIIEQQVKNAQNTTIQDRKITNKHDFIKDEIREQKYRVSQMSMYNIYYSWKLANYIVKVGDDVRQEHFAMQLITEFDNIFKNKSLKLKLTPYEIIPIGPKACLIEMVQNSITIDSLKKQLRESYNRDISLFEFFGLYFGSKKIKSARKYFCQSLSAYSLVCYFLQIKDRHNGNILLNRSGKLVHIDYGFMFTTAPGKGVAIERKVPFKLTSEYVALLEDKAKFFVKSFHQGFNAICEQKDRILSLMKMMIMTKTLPIECLTNANQAFTEMEKRLTPPVDRKKRKDFINSLIDISWDNWRARWYDAFQFCCEGINY